MLKKINQIINHNYDYNIEYKTLKNKRLIECIEIERKKIILFVNELSIYSDYIILSEYYLYDKKNNNFYLDKISITTLNKNDKHSVTKYYILKKNNFCLLYYQEEDFENINIIKNETKSNSKIIKKDFNLYNKVFIENLISMDEYINVQFNLSYRRNIIPHELPSSTKSSK